MTIRDIVRDYVLDDGTVAGLLGTRLYPDMLPQKVTYPAAVILNVDTLREPSLRTVAGLATARLQIDVYAAPVSGASSRMLADQCGAAIRQRLEGFDGTMPDHSTSPATDVRVWIVFDQERSGVEVEIHGGLSRHSADYLVDFQTQDGFY